MQQIPWLATCFREMVSQRDAKARTTNSYRFHQAAGTQGGDQEALPVLHVGRHRAASEAHQRYNPHGCCQVEPRG